MAADKLPGQVACRVLGVSESGYYEHRTRAPSERSIRHAMLTDLITQIHVDSHGIYGGRRIHAELTLAELHVQRVFAKLDPTAVHLGGNHPVRDHELLDNHVWVNTKTAWVENETLIGFGPVGWSTARNPEKPKSQLDLLALVPIRPNDLSFRSPAGNSLEMRWECEHWWLVPASVLFELEERRSKGKSVAPTRLLAPYLVDDDHPLTSERPVEVWKANEIAK